jgi:D-tyrosyl-tRNA(Tyr) deacylase
MRLLLQRAGRACVRVGGEIVGEIGPGLVVLVGVGEGDTPEVAKALARRTVELRIFRDGDGKTNLSLLDVGGDVLAISQFTLYADTTRGRRPSFIRAAAPGLGQALYEVYADAVASHGVRVARGVFGAEMAVELVNDGPMTIWLEADAAIPPAPGASRDG